MNKYNLIEKYIHREFIGKTEFSNLLFNRLIKKSENYNDYKFRNAKHIFITGFARAGTTALLNKIYYSGKFSSLLYSYVPFFLSPRIAYIASKKSLSSNLKFTERAHGDGIKVSINSPECIDEIFWEKAYPKEKICNPLIPSKKILKTYAYLIDRYASMQGLSRMVIKNNTNHLRLISLAKYFKKSNFLVCFRNPIIQSHSLLNQHLRFKKLQEQDPFILEYMNLLGHREFGYGKLRFKYDKCDHVLNEANDSSIQYWLSQWVNCYKFILKNIQIPENNNIHFICYEKLCQDSNYYQNISKRFKISESEFKLELKKDFKEKKDFKLDNELIRESFTLYERMKKSSNF